jgi:hypothetical protein
MTASKANHYFRSALVIAMTAAISFVSCGPKDSVEDNETTGEQSKLDPRSRLTGGSTGNPTLSYCRVPLDIGTVVDPKRPGLMQTVLSSTIDSRCGNYRDARITIRSRQKITLVGRFVCRNGAQANEQVCTAASSDLLSPQKSTLTIPIIADEAIRATDIEANAELY